MSSDPLSLPTGAAALRRRRRFTRTRVTRALAPYGLIAPSIVVIVAILAYPLFELVRLSFQRYGLFELIRHQGVWVGLDNFTAVFHDQVFWQTLARTVVFTAVNVGLTMVLGTLIALLLVKVHAPVRLLLTSGLVLAWAMPAVVAVQLWYWMTNFQNGVLNYVLGLGQHDWYETPASALFVTTTLVVWGAVPFVTITVYAALAQVPRDLLEAASVDGAGPVRSFFDVTIPVIKPILLILASLSIIWDFSVFTQPFLLLQSRPNPDYYLMSMYLYAKSIGIHEYGLGSAIALVMVAIMLCLSFVYVRQMVRTGEVT